MGHAREAQNRTTNLICPCLFTTIVCRRTICCSCGEIQGECVQHLIQQWNVQIFLMLARRTSPVLRSAARSGHEIGKM